MVERLESQFVREGESNVERVGLVVPSNVSLEPGFGTGIVARLSIAGSPAISTRTVSFHYVPSPVNPTLLEDGAVIGNGVYKFLVRDAVLGIFDLPELFENELCWSFSSTAQLNVLAAVKPGETMIVQFNKKFSII